LLKAGALQAAIFRTSANFSSDATPNEKGVFNYSQPSAPSACWGYAAAEVFETRLLRADISDPQEVIARAKALS